MHWLVVLALALSSLLTVWEADLPLAILLGLTAIAGAWQLATGKWQAASFPAPLSWCLLLFGLWAGLSALWSLAPFDTWRAFSVWLLLPIWAWLLSNLNIEKIKRVFFVASGVVFLLSLVAYAQLALGAMPENMRPPSLFANPNTFGSLIVAVLLPLQHLFLGRAEGLPKTWTKIVAGALLCILFGALVLSASRIALIGFAGLSAVQIVLLRQELRGRWREALCYGAALLVFGFIVNQMGGSVAQERFRIIAEPMSYGERLLVWESSWNSFLAQDFFGTGFGALHVPYAALRLYQDTTYGIFAHSDLLQYLAELGIVGLLLALAIFFSFAWMSVTRLRRGFHNKENAIWFTAAAFGILVTALASGITYLLYLPSLLLITAIQFGLWASLYWAEEEALAVQRRPAAAIFFIALFAPLVAQHLSAQFATWADRDLRRFSLEGHYKWNLWAQRMSFDMNPQVLVEWADVALANASQTKDPDALDAIGATLDRLEAMQPSLPQLWLLRGRLALVQEDYTEAEASFKKALESDPTFLPARLMLGRLHRELGREDEIGPLYREGLKWGITEKKYGVRSMKAMIEREGNLPRLTKSRY